MTLSLYGRQHALGYVADAFPVRRPGKLPASINHLLNKNFGYRRRPIFNHAPVVIERGCFGEMRGRYREGFCRIATSRFRALPPNMYQISCWAQVVASPLRCSAPMARPIIMASPFEI